jgi:tRNA threonylcarbamoyladenosine biosynthesis protein TsaE
VLRISKKTFSAQETFNLGCDLAKNLPNNCCVLLSGPLGAGKTQFIKGLCSFFKIDPLEVQSPTYSLHHEYIGNITIHHFDLYRLNDTGEFISRGFLDILDSENPICIEWPSKIDRHVFANKNCIHVDFTTIDMDQREITIYHA